MAHAKKIKPCNFKITTLAGHGNHMEGMRIQSSNGTAQWSHFMEWEMIICISCCRWTQTFSI